MKKLSIILVFIWMIVIFTFSNQTGNISSKQSDIVYNSIKKVINIDDKYMNTATFIIRKNAHMFVYFVLGILVVNMCRYNNAKEVFLLAGTICIMYAISDEFHQLFISGRSGEIGDILIDSINAIIGILLYLLIFKRK